MFYREPRRYGKGWPTEWKGKRYRSRTIETGGGGHITSSQLGREHLVGEACSQVLKVGEPVSAKLRRRMRRRNHGSTTKHPLVVLGTVREGREAGISVHDRISQSYLPLF